MPDITPQTNGDLVITNDTLLKAIFGDEYIHAHVTDFVDDPMNITNERRGPCWAGNWFERHSFDVGRSNQYFTISLFTPEGIEPDKENFLEPGIGLRPVRRKANFKDTRCIVVDDVKDKVPEKQAKLLPKTSWKLETSPGNEQWGFILDEPCGDINRVNNLLDGLVAQGLAPDGKDPGMKGVTRYVRLPEGYNTKANNVDANGNPFKCRMVEWNPHQRVSMESLASPFNIDLDAQRTDGSSDNVTNVTDSAHPIVKLFTDMFMLKGGSNKDGMLNAICPWSHEHTGGDTTGTAIFPRSDGSAGFQCHHGHCQDREWSQLKEWFESNGVDVKALMIAYQTSKIILPTDPQALELQPADNLVVFKTAFLTMWDMLDRFVLLTDGSMVGDTLLKGKPLKMVDFRNNHVGSEYLPPQTPEDPKPKPIKNTKLWLQHRDRMTVEGQGFRPNAETLFIDSGSRRFNTWFEPIHHATGNNDGALLVEKHIQHLIPDEKERKIFILWFAHMIQKPEERPHMAMLMVTPKMGVGRSVLGNIISALVKPYARSKSINEMVDTKFNDVFYKSLILIMDEVYLSSGERKLISTKLNNLVTESRMTINPKGLPEFESDIYTRMLMFTNHVDALYVDENDRRFFVISNPTVCAEKSHYDELYAMVNNSAMIAGAYRWLMNMDISDYQPGLHAPMTPAKSRMIAMNKSELHMQIMDAITEWTADAFTIPDIIKSAGITFLTPNMSRQVNAILHDAGMQKYHKGIKMLPVEPDYLHATKTVKSYVWYKPQTEKSWFSAVQSNPENTEKIRGLIYEAREKAFNPANKET